MDAHTQKCYKVGLEVARLLDHWREHGEIDSLDLATIGCQLRNAALGGLPAVSLVRTLEVYNSLSNPKDMFDTSSVGQTYLNSDEKLTAAIFMEYGEYKLSATSETADEKALRFDLDQAGIENRERDAVELVELRAKVVRYEKRMKRYRNAITQLVESIEQSNRRPTGNYLERIKKAKSRFEAADLLRANACAHVAKMGYYNDAERVAIARDAENHACALERDFIPDLGTGAPCPENQHPWREWLREWRYR